MPITALFHAIELIFNKLETICLPLVSDWELCLSSFEFFWLEYGLNRHNPHFTVVIGRKNRERRCSEKRGTVVGFKKFVDLLVFKKKLMPNEILEPFYWQLDWKFEDTHTINLKLEAGIVNII